MGIRYDLTNVANFESLCYRRKVDGEIKLNPVTHTFIFASLSLGFCEITEKNADEIFERFWIFEQCFGVYINTSEILPGGRMITIPRRIRLEDVRAHIGLRVNASTMTKREFSAHIMRNLKRDAKTALQDQKQEAKAAKEDKAVA